jgi:hypothetical protein
MSKSHSNLGPIVIASADMVPITSHSYHFPNQQRKFDDGDPLSVNNTQAGDLLYYYTGNRTGLSKRDAYVFSCINSMPTNETVGFTGIAMSDVMTRYNNLHGKRDSSHEKRVQVMVHGCSTISYTPLPTNNSTRRTPRVIRQFDRVGAHLPIKTEPDKNSIGGRITPLLYSMEWARGLHCSVPDIIAMHLEDTVHVNQPSNTLTTLPRDNGSLSTNTEMCTLPEMLMMFRTKFDGMSPPNYITEVVELLKLTKKLYDDAGTNGVGTALSPSTAKNTIDLYIHP